ncbi:MAG: hypothetical protein EXR70_14845 [Deltaproteobacteria bacterium]|nr:hypothetical protein [Deltaproteobacteria bacterium]
MQYLIKLAVLLAFLTAAMPVRVKAQSDMDDLYRPWIDYRDGEISVAFEQTPVPFALHAFHARTGFQIVVPSSVEAQLLSLRFNRQALEPAVRSLISTIGYSNFAVIYDDHGRPHRAVVLGVQPMPVATLDQNQDTPLTLEERQQLKKDLDRWNDLKQEERGRIEDRLKTLPTSDDREILVREYGRQLLGLNR